jgi:hypothetical protein
MHLNTYLHFNGDYPARPLRAAQGPFRLAADQGSRRGGADLLFNASSWPCAGRPGGKRTGANADPADLLGGAFWHVRRPVRNPLARQLRPGCLNGTRDQRVAFIVMLL